MKIYLIIFIYIFSMFSCKEGNNSNIDKDITLESNINKMQADTLLAMYVSELEDSYTVDQVLLYTVVEIDSVKYFYSKVKVYDNVTSSYFNEEIIIRFYDPSTHTSPYLTEVNNKGTKFTCNNGTACTDCQFKTAGGGFVCSCIDDEIENPDCSLTVEQNTDLWDVDRFNDGEDILDNIVVAQFLSTSGSFPF